MASPWLGWGGGLGHRLSGAPEPVESDPLFSSPRAMLDPLALPALLAKKAAKAPAVRPAPLAVPAKWVPPAPLAPLARKDPLALMDLL